MNTEEGDKMNNAGIYHRPESEFAFLYTKDRLRIRIQTSRDDTKSVSLISGDFYLFAEEKWYQKQQLMHKTYTTDTHDYWEIEVTAPHRRLAYAFCVTDFSGTEIFYTDQGIFKYEEKIFNPGIIYIFGCLISKKLTVSRCRIG